MRSCKVVIGGVETTMLSEEVYMFAQYLLFPQL
jgi:hypothetical protein